MDTSLHVGYNPHWLRNNGHKGKEFQILKASEMFNVEFSVDF